MKIHGKPELAIALAVALTSCNQAPRSKQAVPENAAPAETRPNDAGSATTSDGARTADNEASTGMPVPDTNTPEHFVVNESVNRS